MTAADVVRDWIGTTPADDVVAATLARSGNDPHRAALSILRRRRADLIQSMRRIDIDQDYSETAHDLRAQIAALDPVIARLEHVVDDAPAAAVIQSAPIRAERPIR